MQLKELETSCGMALYERVGRGIQLTVAGEELALAANSVLDALSGAQQRLDALRGLRTGRLQLAVVSTAKYFAPTILAAFAAAQPDITVQMHVGNRADVTAQLAENRCDLAIMGRPPSAVDTSGAVFATHPQVIIAPPGHRLAGHARIAPRALQGETFLLREDGSGTRAAMESFFSASATTYRAGMEAGSNETIKQAVIAGMGLAFISAHTIALEIDTGRLVVLDIQGMPVEREWHVLHRRGKRLSPAARAFFDFVRREGAGYIDTALDFQVPLTRP
jgi:DNA-binding transcriptional LysR family regulator